MYRRILTTMIIALMVAPTGVNPAVAGPGDPGEPVVLHDQLPPRSDFPGFKNDRWPTVRITPDGSTVVYHVGFLNRFTTDFFSVAIEGGPATPLSLQSGNDADGHLSPDGRWLVFRQPQPGTGSASLFVAPAGGGTPTPLWEGGHLTRVESYRISNDSSTVYVVARQPTPTFGSASHLLAIPISGGAPRTIVGGEGVASGLFQLTSDGTGVLIELAGPPPHYSSGLHHVPIDGAAPVLLDMPLGDMPGGELKMTPNGTHIVWRPRTADALRSAPTDGSPVTELALPFPEEGHLRSFEISPDGRTVVYLADQRVDERYGLYSVPVGGGTPTRLSGSLPAGGDVSWYAISPDGSRVVFRADQRSNNVHELFCVPIDGGRLTRLNAELPRGGDVKPNTNNTRIAISPDGETVFYIADQDRNNRRELYRVPISGGVPVRVTPTLSRWSDIRTFELSPTGERIAFVGDLDTNGVGDLYVLDADGGPTERMSGPMVHGGDVKPLIRWSPTGDHLVFVADARTNNQRELFSVRVPD